MESKKIESLLNIRKTDDLTNTFQKYNLEEPQDATRALHLIGGAEGSAAEWGRKLAETMFTKPNQRKEVGTYLQDLVLKSGHSWPFLETSKTLKAASWNTIRAGKYPDKQDRPATQEETTIAKGIFAVVTGWARHVGKETAEKSTKSNEQKLLEALATARKIAEKIGNAELVKRIDLATKVAQPVVIDAKAA